MKLSHRVDFYFSPLWENSFTFPFFLLDTIKTDVKNLNITRKLFKTASIIYRENRKVRYNLFLT